MFGGDVWGAVSARCLLGGVFMSFWPVGRASTVGSANGSTVPGFLLVDMHFGIVSVGMVALWGAAVCRFESFWQGCGCVAVG